VKSSLAIQADLLGTMKQTLMALFGRATPLETWGFAAVFVLTLMIAYKLTARACGAQARAFMVLVPGFFLMLLASAAIQVFWTSAWIPQLAAVVLVFLIAVLPLTNVIQRTSWISSLLIWGVTLLIASAVFYAESAVSRAVHQGAGSGALYKQRHEQLDDWFKRSGR
jgi:hypothetical protein